MGLNAFVFCDCFERGLVRTPPEPEWLVYIDETGQRSTGATVLEAQMAFDRWDASACMHEGGELASVWISNISGVGLLRQVIGAYPERFPLILGGVIYNGSHGGDFIDVPHLRTLQDEVSGLAQLHAPDQEWEWLVRDFEAKMSQLTATAVSVGKPLCF